MAAGALTTYRGGVLRRLAALTAVSLLATLLSVAGHAPEPAAAASDRRIHYWQWDKPDMLRRGTFSGTRVRDGGIVLDRPTGRGEKLGRPHVWGSWTSPWVAPGFPLTELIPSWKARTPGATWIRVDVRGMTPGGAWTGWDSISKWAASDSVLRRHSEPRQADGGAWVNYDTWTVPGGVKRWQLRVTLLRPADGTLTPHVDTLGAVASRLPAGVPRTSRPLGVAAGKVLPVPEYSQMIHRGEYPQYGGGGQAWCSPTATSMVLGYYRKLPPPERYRWVDRRYPDRFVAHAARQVFDHSYDGAGNWPFNTAYAANLLHRAFVTRLADLRSAERLIAAGIPVVTSISFGPGELAGAPIGSTSGHLVVIVGFTRNGDPIVNDPAAPRNRDVRRTYRRGQFEAAWLRKSGGLAYVIRDYAHPLPADGPSW